LIQQDRLLEAREGGREDEREGGVDLRPSIISCGREGGREGGAWGGGAGGAEEERRDEGDGTEATGEAGVERDVS